MTKSPAALAHGAIRCDTALSIFLEQGQFVLDIRLFCHLAANVALLRITIRRSKGRWRKAYLLAIHETRTDC